MDNKITNETSKKEKYLKEVKKYDDIKTQSIQASLNGQQTLSVMKSNTIDAIIDHGLFDIFEYLLKEADVKIQPTSTKHSLVDYVLDTQQPEKLEPTLQRIKEIKGDDIPYDKSTLTGAMYNAVNSSSIRLSDIFQCLNDYGIKPSYASALFIHYGDQTSIDQAVTAFNTWHRLWGRRRGLNLADLIKNIGQKQGYYTVEKKDRLDWIRKIFENKDNREKAKKVNNDVFIKIIECHIPGGVDVVIENMALSNDDTANLFKQATIANGYQAAKTIIAHTSETDNIDVTALYNTVLTDKHRPRFIKILLDNGILPPDKYIDTVRDVLEIAGTLNKYRSTLTAAEV